MLKKLSWIVLLLTSISMHPAYGYCSKECAQVAFEDGFYGALSLGVNWGMADWSGLSSVSLVDDIHDPNAIFQSWTPKGTSQDSGKIMGSIALGYQLVDARLYLGAQVAGTFSAKRTFNLDDMRLFSQIASEGLPPPSTVSGSSHSRCSATLGCCEFDADLKPGILIFRNLLV